MRLRCSRTGSAWLTGQPPPERWILRGRILIARRGVARTGLRGLPLRLWPTWLLGFGLTLGARLAWIWGLGGAFGVLRIPLLLPRLIRGGLRLPRLGRLRLPRLVGLAWLAHSFRLARAGLVLRIWCTWLLLCWRLGLRVWGARHRRLRFRPGLLGTLALGWVRQRISLRGAVGGLLGRAWRSLRRGARGLAHRRGRVERVLEGGEYPDQPDQG